MKVTDIKALCTRLSTEAEDRDERNAYNEIKRHIDQARPTKEGLLLDLAYMATDFQRRAGEIRQRAPLSALVVTLETKARVCQQLVGKLAEGCSYDDRRHQGPQTRASRPRPTLPAMRWS